MAYSLMRRINPNVHIHWAGFRSTTFELGQQGWELRTQEDYSSLRLGFAALNHKFRCVLIGQMIEFDFFAHVNQEVPKIAQIYDIKFNCDLLSAETRILKQEWPEPSKMKTVEHVPEVINTEITKIKDMFLFRPAPKQEILVEPASVPDALDLILKMQSSKQVELREKQKQMVKRQIHEEEQKSVLISHAEIMSIN